MKREEKCFQDTKNSRCRYAVSGGSVESSGTFNRTEKLESRVPQQAWVMENSHLP